MDQSMLALFSLDCNTWLCSGQSVLSIFIDFYVFTQAKVDLVSVLVDAR